MHLKKKKLYFSKNFRVDCVNKIFRVQWKKYKYYCHTTCTSFLTLIYYSYNNNLQATKKNICDI